MGLPSTRMRSNLREKYMTVSMFHGEMFTKFSDANVPFHVDFISGHAVVVDQIPMDEAKTLTR